MAAHRVSVWSHLAEGDGGCWIWTGHLNAGGYGKFKPWGADRYAMAHRWIYEFFVGPIPEGLHLDHLCRVRACCNPWHLEPVPQGVNNGRAWVHQRKTHCPSGHEFTPSNTGRRGSGWRYCKRCDAIRRAAQRAHRGRPSRAKNPTAAGREVA